MRRLLLAIAITALPGGVRAQKIEPVADRVAGAWNKNDAAALTGFASKGGITLQLAGERVGPVGARQAAAALRSLFDGRETVSTKAGMAREIGGEPRRAYIELSWITRPRGTSENDRSTVFFSFVLEDGQWRVTEIRHMR